ncbi:MAG: AIR synthase-related protein, partial [Candidatus Bathyarchaeota archaeon]|nr:AIR synthase-related protein [Candidatus Bathyarchaeota archaeon]
HVEWREMYEDFNMGIGFEFIVEPGVAEEVIRIAENFGIGVQVIGRCEKSEEGNTLKITCKSDEFRYARD